MALASNNLPPAARHLPTWIGAFLLASLAWIPTLLQSLSMPPMPGTMGMSFIAFLLFWTVMMAAMMLPALAPMLSLHLAAYRKDVCCLHPILRLSTFLCGYLLFWAFMGVPVFFLALWAQILAVQTPSLAILIGAGTLIIAGIYQLLPLQGRCLTHCYPSAKLHYQMLQMECPTARTPIQEIGVGLRHGFVCLGSCGGLMLALVAASVMNIPAMLLITLLIFAIKLWRYGRQLSILVGLGLIFIGILALHYPVTLIPGFVLPG
jgi:predicted metal-binding membrane protein